MKKIITKIEGEATLHIKGDEVIEWVDIEFWQYRGIEDYLVNKHYMDALVINPRVCGICGHSHLIATAKAIENAFNAEITDKAKYIRNLTLNFEIIQNHIKWFYITLFPTQIIDKKYMFKALNVSQKLSKAIALIGGQYPHNSYAIPGGITSDITYVELIKVENIIKEILQNLELFDDLELFFSKIPKTIGKSLNKFLVANEIDITKIKENQSSSKFQNVTYDGKYFEVGPLARMKQYINFVYEEYEDSIYSRIFARIYEIEYLLKQSIEIINQIDLSQDSYIKPKIISNKGYSIVEAPRGILIHEIEILNEKIKNYNIIVPTQFNLSNGSINMPSSAQKALINEKKEYLDTIFKCFDICAVCMTH
jgi:Ni,Fe-hydrogenase I large subunit